MPPPAGEVLRRVDALCSAPAGPLSLRRAVLDELARVVSFDAYAFVLTDPATSVGSSPLAEVPFLPELPTLLPTLIRLRYLTPVNRWTGLATGQARSLLAATDGHPERSLVWGDLLSRYGVVDVASSVFRDRFGCWGFLELWRSAPGAPFTDADLAVLGSATATITTGLRSSLAGALTGTARAARAQSGPVVLLLSPGLAVRAQTAATEAYLRALVPGPDERQPIPAGAYNVGAQLLAAEAGVDANPARSRVHLGDGAWLTMRAARIGEAAEPAPRDVAVTMEPTTAAERVDLFCRVFGLTARESAVLRQLGEGSDTREAARRLTIPEHTVQDHLKAMFAKTGAHSRQQLLAQALGS